MGKRIVYYRPTNGKSLRENFIADYAAFRDWMLWNNNESITKFDEREFSEEFETLLKETTSANDLDAWSQATTDQLVAAYFLIYCDRGEGQDRFELIGPHVSTTRYDDSHDAVRRTEDAELKTVWNTLINGRSIKDGAPFIVPENSDDTLIGYWDARERQILRRGVGALYKKNAELVGLEVVLNVLKAMEADNSDLIFDVER